MAKYAQEVQELIDAGCEAIYLWGVRADGLLAEKKIDLIGKAVDIAKAQGVPSGVGCHELGVVMACEENKINCDFYIKTFHHHNYPSAKLNHDSMWCKNPEETTEFMKKVDQAVDRLQDHGRRGDPSRATPCNTSSRTGPISSCSACSTTRSPKTCGSPRRSWRASKTGRGRGGQVGSSCTAARAIDGWHELIRMRWTADHDDERLMNVATFSKPVSPRGPEPTCSLRGKPPLRTPPSPHRSTSPCSAPASTAERS